jgi:alpha-beta hydrolase superfamily lysophospholipase
MTLSETAEQRRDVAWETVATWFGDPDRPLLGWISHPVAAIRPSGVVIAPPVGYEYWSSHRTLRTLAERLAAAGHTVMRLDYAGTGDSAGDQWEPGRIAAWRRSIALAVAHMREGGIEEVSLVGVRLGATLALLEGAAAGAARIAAWLPVAAGRRYARELRLLATPVPEDCDPLEPGGTMTFAGNVFSAETFEALRGLDLAQLARPPAPAALVVDDPSGASEPGVAALRALGVAVTHLRLEGSEESLRTPPEFAVIPGAILDAICDWFGPAPPARAALPAPRHDMGRPVAMRWRGDTVIETAMRVGELGHVGIATEPASGVPAPTTLVLLNPGSETHVGPGRAWVELARDLALRGRRTIRLDFRGWGESADAGRAPGRPYDEWCEQDTVAIVRELRRSGFDRVALCGLCAAAWIALRVASDPDTDADAHAAGVIALNPQLYWKRGDPVEIDWDLIRARRADEIRRVERGARVGLWSMLDRLGHRSPPARWLDRLAAARRPVHLLFAENDDGLIYLRGRHHRRLEQICRGGTVTVRELAGVDHPMHLAWMRSRVTRALADALADIDGRP